MPYTDYQIKTITKLIEDEFKKALLLKEYPYAPGFNGDAYSNGRKGEYNGQSLKGVSDKRASGGLLNSIRCEYDETQGAFLLYMADYYKYVDEGRQPGKYVPIEPLQKWASLRLGLNEKEAKGMAYGMSINIQKFGIAPSYFYTNAVEAMDSILSGPMLDMVGVGIEEILDNLLEKTFKIE